MRASLVSATSLIALLLVEGEPAHAVATMSAADQTVDFNYALIGVTPAQSISDPITLTGAQRSSFTAESATSPFTTSITAQTIGNTSLAIISEGFKFSPTVAGSYSSVVVARDSLVSTPLSITLTGTGVAPIAALSSSSTNYFLVNGSGTGQTASVLVTNSGNGNLSGTTTTSAGTVSNLRGTITGGATSSTTGFKGTAASISVGDTSSASYTYTFAPTKVGQAATTPLIIATLSNGSSDGRNATFAQTFAFTGTGVAPIQSVANSSAAVTVRAGTSTTASITVSNVGNGNKATGSVSNSISNLNGSVSAVTLGTGFSGPGTGSTISLPDSSSTTVAYTYSPTSRSNGTVSSTVTLAFSNGNSNLSNTAQSVISTLYAQAVGPVFNSSSYGTSFSGSSPSGTITNISTPTASPRGSVGSAGATIAFGTVGYNKSETLYLLLKNTSTDPGGALTDLTIEKYSIAGAGAYEFSASLTAGSVISENGQLLLPITIVSSGGGLLNSTLTIFTDQNTSLGGSGDTFTYALTAFAVPEPATIAVLGAGLAGLAGLRRRRLAAKA